jgi:hypothetical protein
MNIIQWNEDEQAAFKAEMGRQGIIVTTLYYEDDHLNFAAVPVGPMTAQRVDVLREAFKKYDAIAKARTEIA